MPAARGVRLRHGHHAHADQPRTSPCRSSRKAPPASDTRYSAGTRSSARRRKITCSVSALRPAPDTTSTTRPPMAAEPMIDNEAIKKQKNVTGILRPRPRMSDISVLCANTMIAPAQKNRVILPNACMTMCMRRPHALRCSSPAWRPARYVAELR